MTLCNLHNDIETLGLSLQLWKLTASCYTSHSDTSSQLECARADIGTVSGEIKLRERDEAMPDRQLAFLQKADRATKRLYFLWDESSPCGCSGGCPFLDYHLHWPTERDTPGDEHCTDTSRYFSFNEPSSHLSSYLKEDLSSLDPMPDYLDMSSCSCIEQLHRVLLVHHGFSDDELHNTPPASQAQLPDAVEEMSQGSDSFWSAKSSLSSFGDPVSSTLKPKVVSQGASPSSEPRGVRSPGSRHRGRAHKNSMAAVEHKNYQHVLDCYKFDMKSVKIPSKSRLLLDSQESGTSGTNENGSSRGEPYFVLFVPKLVEWKTGLIPTVVESLTSQDEWSSEQPPQASCTGGESLATVSTAVSIEGNIGIVLSPPALSVVERYLCVCVCT